MIFSLLIKVYDLVWYFHICKHKDWTFIQVFHDFIVLFNFILAFNFFHLFHILVINRCQQHLTEDLLLILVILFYYSKFILN